MREYGWAAAAEAARYLWHGSRNYIQLTPQAMPAHIFRIRRRVRTERDFDYYL